ncbi:Guanine nucleotide-binding protein subunit alpha [Smittium culicis]|uniref:Guanine nucleotide-binding protein subunit alpha n=1 Tax=Smittium culicis TaxID=133412 RepID=A0A1R1YU95_9FUNG|nr:Guanine nucleotide-binding protein subunit alpha [Smittium culicis]
MGLCGSKSFDEMALNSEKIDRELRSDREKLRSEIKILLLGSGESGKSTIVKQMKIMYQNGFSVSERNAFISIIHRNMLESAQELSIGFKTCEISPSSEKNALFVEKMLSLDIESMLGVVVTPEVLEGIESLWKDPTVPSLLLRSKEFYLMDSANYFFDNARRICCNPNYIPTDSDILRSRSKTTGIVETRFSMGKKTIHMFDVGGQRSERKKWIHCFEDVTSILFCVAISEYDQVLLEQSNHNRMDESLELFQSIVNSRWFVRSSIVLFLNKLDIFLEKIYKSPLEHVYPEYSGGPDKDLALKFIMWKFKLKNRIGLPLYPQ